MLGANGAVIATVETVGELITTATAVEAADAGGTTRGVTTGAADTTGISTATGATVDAVDMTGAAAAAITGALTAADAAIEACELITAAVADVEVGGLNAARRLMNSLNSVDRSLRLVPAEVVAVLMVEVSEWLMIVGADWVTGDEEVGEDCREVNGVEREAWESDL